MALFMYMRLLGYPAEKISILTTYNGQKQMIREVVQHRCTSNRLFGVPHKVSKVKDSLNTGSLSAVYSFCEN